MYEESILSHQRDVEVVQAQLDEHMRRNIDSDSGSAANTISLGDELNKVFGIDGDEEGDTTAVQYNTVLKKYSDSATQYDPTLFSVNHSMQNVTDPSPKILKSSFGIASQTIVLMAALVLLAYLAPAYSIPGGATYYDRSAWNSFNSMQAASEGFGPAAGFPWVGGGADGMARGWPT